MDLHELCELFPKIDGESFEALKADIKANGLVNPIIMLNDKILDGQNRFRACQELGIKPKFVQYKGENVLEYVLAQNLHRRHLTAGQSASIVALAQDWAKAHTVGAKSKESDATTIAKRAEKSGASRRTQITADKVAKEAPELAKKVAKGEMSLTDAVKEITPPKEEDEAFDHFDITEAYEAEVKENKRLQSVIDALTSDDKDKEIISLSESVKSLQGRINQAIKTEAEAVKQAKYYGSLLTSIRKVVGCEQNSDILLRIKALK
jgi:ParB-like chromosome segregation protein Spo0J